MACSRQLSVKSPTSALPVNRRPIRAKHRRRVNKDCDEILARFGVVSNIRDVGFYDYDHIAILKYGLSGNARAVVTTASVLSEWEASQTQPKISNWGAPYESL
jgi:hypothetical protein